MLFRVFVVGMVLFGSVAKVALVWDLADLFMALMAITNLVAIAILGKYAYIALHDYMDQKRAGIVEPEFDPAILPSQRCGKKNNYNNEKRTSTRAALIRQY
jgi:AGCS family alanine or glycine:cation symporter